jgi:hypothetical protein
MQQSESRTAMAAIERRYSKEEFARRGDALVESKVRPNLTPADEDKFVAIDVETGEFELDKDEMKATDRLRKRVRDPQIWLVHVTLGYLHRFAGRSSDVATASRVSRDRETRNEFMRKSLRGND